MVFQQTDIIMINWGIIGAGNIARVFCNSLRFSKTSQARGELIRVSEKI